MTIEQKLGSVVEIFGCTTLKWVLSLDTTREIKAEISRELRNILDAFICNQETSFVLIERTKCLLSKIEEIDPSAREFSDHIFWFLSLLELDNDKKENLRNAA